MKNKSNLYDIWIGHPRPTDKRILAGNLDPVAGLIPLTVVGLKNDVENAKLLLETHLSFYEIYKDKRIQA